MRSARSTCVAVSSSSAITQSSHAPTRSLYYYPESTFVRTTEDSLQPFVNPVQFDVGVRHALPAGARALYVSFLLGLPINHGDGVENETEIRELLRLADEAN